MRPRWRKLLADVRAERGRLAALTLAVAVALAALGTVLGAWTVLTRAIATNYLGTRPAEAVLELEADIEPDTLARVRARPDVAAAEARAIVEARVRIGEDWRPLLLFVVEDVTRMQLATFAPERGAWPPPPGSVLLERSAFAFAGVELGDSLEVELDGAQRQFPIAGAVHDPALAPAWQERTVYAYATRATAGLHQGLHALAVDFVGDPDIRAITRAAGELGAALAAEGHAVHEIRIPPPRQHPHQRQMAIVLLLLLALAGFTFVLASVVVATSLATMLARQIREIGVLKTLGARRRQLVALYLALVVGLGAIAYLVAVPIAVAGSHAVSARVAQLLNLEIADAVAPWVFAVLAAAALVVPTTAGLVPVLAAARTPVRVALDSHGASRAPRPMRAWWPVALRNAMRRRSRAAFVLGMLATAGAMFATSLALAEAWRANAAKIRTARHYDIEARLTRAIEREPLAAVRALPGVRALEVWGHRSAALERVDGIDVVRTYPDGGHGSFAMMAPPVDSTMIDLPLLAGRRLRDQDDDAVVLNHAAAAMARAAVGGQVTLSLAGRETVWTVVGIVEEVGASGVAYVTPPAYQRVTGTAPAQLLRVVTETVSAQARADILRAIDRALVRSGAAVEQVLPMAELRNAVTEHVIVFVILLVIAAAILAFVGLVGLAAALGTAVVERTSEIAVMKAVGATRRRIARMIVGEAVALALASWPLAVLLSLPATAWIEDLVGRLGFLAPLPFTLSPLSWLGWLVLVVVGAITAAALPARRAAALTVREGLTRI